MFGNAFRHRFLVDPAVLPTRDRVHLSDRVSNRGDIAPCRLSRHRVFYPIPQFNDPVRNPNLDERHPVVYAACATFWNQDFACLNRPEPPVAVPVKISVTDSVQPHPIRDVLYVPIEVRPAF